MKKLTFGELNTGDVFVKYPNTENESCRQQYTSCKIIDQKDFKTKAMSMHGIYEIEDSEYVIKILLN